MEIQIGKNEMISVNMNGRGITFPDKVELCLGSFIAYSNKNNNDWKLHLAIIKNISETEIELLCDYYYNSLTVSDNCKIQCENFLLRLQTKEETKFLIEELKKINITYNRVVCKLERITYKKGDIVVANYGNCGYIEFIKSYENNQLESLISVDNNNGDDYDFIEPKGKEKPDTIRLANEDEIKRFYQTLSFFGKYIHRVSNSYVLCDYDTLKKKKICVN